MARINVLDKQIAELIAAGEVVERPASIVKELVENAIDAGATAVTVEIQAGGVRYIRVTDNGSGILREDVANAFLRHATSKVRVQEDLSNILTMGFRGEALASIAAMCRVDLLTRTPDDVAGTHYAIAGGEELVCEDAGCPAGTTITVRDVFYNTPARMKFLKKDVSEGNSVAAAVEKAALGNPGVAFKFIRDGAVKLQTPGDGQTLSSIRCILGREFAENAIPVDYQHGNIRLAGYICKPLAARGSRSMQNFFINHRFIRSKTCMAALEESYKNALMVGKFPSCVLDLTVPPQVVDVNVHPAKIEVRFADEKSIFDLVYYGCKTALGQSRLQPEIKAKSEPFNPFALHTEPAAPQQQRLSVNEYKMLLEKQMYREEPKRPSLDHVFSAVPAQPVRTPSWKLDVETPPEPKLQQQAPASFLTVESPEPPNTPYTSRNADDPPIRLTYEPVPKAAQEPSVSQGISAKTADIFADALLVGELFDTYLVLQSGDEMILVDKHAAHERLIFNKLLREGVGADKQILLTPVSVRLSPEEYAAVLDHLELFAKAGLSVEDFGDSFVVVREVAPILADADLAGIVEEFAQKLLHYSSRLLPQYLEEFYHTVACRAAIKAHDKTPVPSLEQLITLLIEDGDAQHCPHGRPVAIRMRRQEIEKKFGRLG